MEFVELPSARLLRRVSLDLRGTLPSVEELDAVEADPSLLPSYADAYLDAPTADDRLVSLLAERWHTVLDDYEVDGVDYGLPNSLADRFAHAVGEEPLRIISHVVRNRLPWSEVVTADYTFTTDVLAPLWPLEYPEGAMGWQKARYTDGRPAAGVLSTNGFYWRYVTNVSNKNRGRVAALSRLLLCTDLLDRPVAFQRGSSLNPEEALRTEPTCVTCHATVDPIAASFFGFWWTIQYNPFEMQTYHPERERLGPELLGTEPGWHGVRTAGLTDLGWYVSNDPRYDRCAVESFAEQLWQRKLTLEDFSTIDGLARRFEDNGTLARELLLDLVATPEYRAGGLTADASAATRASARTERLLTPNQQRLVYAELAFLEWINDNYTVLENDVTGVRTLGGGVDGYSVTQPQRLPGLTWVMVNQRAAQAASQRIVSRDFGATEPRELLAPGDARPGDPAFTYALERLHWRLYALRAEDDALDALGALWEQVERTDGPEVAWTAVLEAMLRDPLFVSY